VNYENSTRIQSLKLSVSEAKKRSLSGPDEKLSMLLPATGEMVKKCYVCDVFDRILQRTDYILRNCSLG
jgi:hypothetical protein